MSVVPAWLEQVSAVDFSREKDLLTQLEAWAGAAGWTVSNGSELPQQLQQRTDVLFIAPNREDRIRLAVLPKSSKGAGAIRLDSSVLRTLELVYWPRKKSWRVFAGGVPIEDNVRSRGWKWLADLLLKP